MSEKRELITLTAKDLDGCRPFDVRMLVRFTHVDTGWIYTTAINTGNRVLHNAIQCDPHDYIRSWLGPRGEMHTDPERAFIYKDKLFLCFGGCFARDYLCPPALAAAMGDSVWRRTENGWAPVE